MTHIERPESTLNKRYLRERESMLQWRTDNKEWVKNYNREYQRKLRKDPQKMADLNDRTSLRCYLRGFIKKSYKIETKLGLNRDQLCQREGCKDNEEFKIFIKNHEIDHILPGTWFLKEENKHLNPFRCRGYNIQFVPRFANRRKHNWVDETDPRVMLVIAKMQMEHEVLEMVEDGNGHEKIRKLSVHLAQLEKQVKAHG